MAEFLILPDSIPKGDTQDAETQKRGLNGVPFTPSGKASDRGRAGHGSLLVS